MTETAVNPSADVSVAIANALRGQIEAANRHADRIASQNVGKLVHDLRETSDDEKVAKFRAYIEDMDAKRELAVTQIDEYIKSNLVQTDENVDVDKEKAAYALAKDAVVGGKALATQMGVTLPEDLPELKSLRGTSGNAGSSGPKPRVGLITVDGTEIVKETTKDGVTKRTSNFTLAAAHMSKVLGEDVASKDLQTATFEAAKTNDLKSLPAETEISFSFSAGTGEKARNFNVVVFTPPAK